ncbi:hypothetical protein TUMEXPCC7403_22775 [Tumidithrix helvetica PCC 7403]
MKLQEVLQRLEQLLMKPLEVLQRLEQLLIKLRDR